MCNRRGISPALDCSALAQAWLSRKTRPGSARGSVHQSRNNTGPAAKTPGHTYAVGGSVKNTSAPPKARALYLDLSDLSDLSSVSSVSEHGEAAGKNQRKGDDSPKDPRCQTALGGGGGGRSRFLKKAPPPATSSSQSRAISKTQKQQPPQPWYVSSSQRGSQSAALSRVALIEDRIHSCKKAQAPPQLPASQSLEAPLPLSAQSSSDLSPKGKRFIKKRASVAVGTSITATADKSRAANACTPLASSGTKPARVVGSVSLDSDEEFMRKLLGDSLDSTEHSPLRPGRTASMKIAEQSLGKSNQSVSPMPSPPQHGSPFRSSRRAKFRPSLLSLSPPSSSVSSLSEVLSLEELFPAVPNSEDSYSERSPVSSEDFKINIMRVDDLEPVTLGFTEERTREEKESEEEEVLDCLSDFEGYSRAMLDDIANNFSDNVGEPQSLSPSVVRYVSSSQRGSQSAALSRVALIEDRIHSCKKAQTPPQLPASQSLEAPLPLSVQSSSDLSSKGKRFIKKRAAVAVGTSIAATADKSGAANACTPLASSGTKPARVVGSVSLDSDEEFMRKLLGDSLDSTEHSPLRPGRTASMKIAEQSLGKSNQSVSLMPSPPQDGSPFRSSRRAKFRPSVLSLSPPRSSVSSLSEVLSLEELFPAVPNSEDSYSERSPVSSEDFKINIMRVDDLEPVTLGSTEERTREEKESEEEEVLDCLSDFEGCSSQISEDLEGDREEEVLDYLSDFESYSHATLDDVSSILSDNVGEPQSLSPSVVRYVSSSQRGSQSAALSRVALIEDRIHSCKKAQTPPQLPASQSLEAPLPLSAQSSSDLSPKGKRFIKKRAAVAVGTSIAATADKSRAANACTPLASSGTKPARVVGSVSLDSDEEYMRKLLGDSLDSTEHSPLRPGRTASMKIAEQSLGKSNQSVSLMPSPPQDGSPFRSSRRAKFRPSVLSLSPPSSSVSSLSEVLSLEELFPAVPNSEDSYSERSPVSSEDFKINVMTLNDLEPVTLGFTEERTREEKESEEEEVLDYLSDFEGCSSSSQISERLEGDREEEVLDHSSDFKSNSRATEEDYSSNSKEAAVQTQPDPLAYTLSAGMAAMGPAVGVDYMDPTPVASNIVSAETVEALSTHSPAAFALNDMLRQQLAMTRHFEESSRCLHSSLLQSLGPAYRYTTLKDTKKLISKHKPSKMRGD